MELYSILELDYDDRHNITLEQIKQQFRKLAKKYHPDKSKENSHEKFIKIRMAYELLIQDKNKYDNNKTVDIDWFEILKTKYSWMEYLFNSKEDLQQDLSNLFFQKNWTNLKSSENLVRNLGKKINPNINWKKDIILKVTLKELNYTEPIIINYNKYSSKITGIIIDFVIEEIKLPIVLDPEYNYNEELFTIENCGNDIIENNKIVTGDLYIDIN